ncbi:TPA: pyridoxamine 5'-phosphate oxidase family protein [Candidatus Saccharibacteria bacterium]|nr:pyridoxamine 5'-phosphate oxidase family protein [Candidatus Saccharibacteria bacterium]HIO87324.1 pyridoxamine 5'-phosphate oxidase family protein [Candidatus Saccharibacteria bacterium]
MAATTDVQGETASNILKELRSEDVMTLCTMNLNLRPHLSVVYYSVSDAFELFFITKVKTNKHKHLQINPNVTALVYEEKRQLSIQITGTAHAEEPSDETHDMLEKVFEKASKHNFNAPPIAKLWAGGFVMYKIKPSTITMALFTRPQAGGYDMFEAINF